MTFWSLAHTHTVVNLTKSFCFAACSVIVAYIVSVCGCECVSSLYSTRGAAPDGVMISQFITLLPPFRLQGNLTMIDLKLPSLMCSLTASSSHFLPLSLSSSVNLIFLRRSLGSLPCAIFPPNLLFTLPLWPVLLLIILTLSHSASSSPPLLLLHLLFPPSLHPCLSVSLSLFPDSLI